jgi:hypothetical protein
MLPTSENGSAGYGIKRDVPYSLPNLEELALGQDTEV